MRAYFRLQRLFLKTVMKPDLEIRVSREQANYLLNVIRLKHDDHLLVFNAQDGEWLAKIKLEGRKNISLVLIKQTRVQPKTFDLTILFAPIKVGRLDYMVQKMVEMGAGVLQPIFTDHTQLHKINEKRLSAHIIESAEQCGILSIPQLCEPLKLADLLENWNRDIPIIFCDEAHDVNNSIEQLEHLQSGRYALLIGPEGGFSRQERTTLNNLDFVISIALGPRILRADTAVIAAMTLVQATIGDWN